jgi:hypothetical protein
LRQDRRNRSNKTKVIAKPMAKFLCTPGFSQTPACQQMTLEQTVAKQRLRGRRRVAGISITREQELPYG